MSISLHTSVALSWRSIFTAAQHCVLPERGKKRPSKDEARRVANIALACAVAHRWRIIGGARPKFDETAAADALQRFAIGKPVRIAKSSPGLKTVAANAIQAAELIERPEDFDGWVQASQSADAGRKGRGAYATPMPFALQLAEITLGPILRQTTPIRVIDPGAGAGALLIGCIQVLTTGENARRPADVVRHLYGLELDPIARELCCLLMWLTANDRNVRLDAIARNIRLGNAITTEWWQRDHSAFDAVVMNPPWESLRHRGRGKNAEGERSATLRRLSVQQAVSPELPPLYSMQGTGDRNLFKAFVELAPHLVRHGGRIGALVPAAFASDLGMSPLRRAYLDGLALDSWTSFENRRRYFPIDSRYKFGILTGTRDTKGTARMSIKSFAVEPTDVRDGHLHVTRSDIERLGGPTLMIPEFCNVAEMRALRQVFREGEPFFESPTFKRPRYCREIDLSLGRKRQEFTRIDCVRNLTNRGNGQYINPDGTLLAPLIEGRMVGQYDFFQKTWLHGTGRRARWALNGTRGLAECRPQYVIPARSGCGPRIAICDVTAATNTRTVLATLVPDGWVCGNTAPVIQFRDQNAALVALGVMNSMVFDWIARRIVGGLHLNKFYLERFVWPRLDHAARARILTAASGLALNNPRTRQCNGLHHLHAMHAMDFVEAHTTIETEVARGFGLTSEMLRVILSSDGSDRRGFWRFFAAEPRAVTIASRVLAEYETCTEPAEPVVHLARSVA